MPEETDPTRYDSEPTRVRAGSGKPWLAAWGAVAVAVVGIGVAGTVLSRAPEVATPSAAEAAVVATPAPSALAATPAPSAAPTLAAHDGIGVSAAGRRTVPLVVESTDFHGNGGAAYYGIGGKLIRALTPVPTRTPNPGDAPE